MGSRRPMNMSQQQSGVAPARSSPPAGELPHGHGQTSSPANNARVLIHSDRPGTTSNLTINEENQSVEGFHNTIHDLRRVSMHPRTPNANRMVQQRRTPMDSSVPRFSDGRRPTTRTSLLASPIRPQNRIIGPSGPLATAAAVESAVRRNRTTLLASRRRATVMSLPIDDRPVSSPSTNANSSFDEVEVSSSRHSTRSSTLSTFIPFAVTTSTSPSRSRRDRSRTRSRSPLPQRSYKTILKRSRSNASEGLDKMNSRERFLYSDKCLTKLFRYFNWNELLPLRLVNKKWLDAISSEPQTEDRLGVITIRKTPCDKILELYNESPVIWKKWRILSNVFIDLMDPVQLGFWSKHGPHIKYLEIRNKSMTLSGLVEILSRCPSLEHFLVTWNPEMYSFNSELIKKYYGVNFYNGNFANMQELVVEKSCYLTDTALWCLIKWCGGSLKTLKLTYPPESAQDSLTRLKPRWTIKPLIDYFERFGYTQNLRSLDFSWSNLSPTDLSSLANTNNISSIREITLNHCKLNDSSISYFLSKVGHSLEKLRVADVPITEHAFFTGAIDRKAIHLPKLLLLNISGPRGEMKSLSFLAHCPDLVELIAAKTSWLDYNTLMKPLRAKVAVKPLLHLDFGGRQIITHGNKQIDSNQIVIWFANLTSALGHLTHLNLNEWRSFGKNENFRMICQSLPLLEELRIRGWKDLTDSGVTGLSAEKLHDNNALAGTKRASWSNRTYIGSLNHLTVLDLSGSSISDASLKYGVYNLPVLRKFGFEHTEVSDMGMVLISHLLHSIDQIMIEGCDKIVNPEPKYRRPDGRFIYVAKF